MQKKLTLFLRWVLIYPMRLDFQSATALRFLLENGGDDGNRTHDPLLAGQVLSQLSYTPVSLRVLFSKDLSDP